MTRADPSPGLRVSWREHGANLALAASALRYVPRVPRAMLEDLIPGTRDLEITIRHELQARSLPHGEAFVLSLIVACLRPRRVFEIGTGSGQTTLLIARQSPEALIDTLDLGRSTPTLGTQKGEPPWVDLETIGAAWRGTDYAAGITQHLADSASFDYAPFRGAVDLVFVDGAHTYEYVKSDSRAALEIVAPGGVVVWDDCNYVCPGVARALLELRGQGHPVHRIYGTRFAALRVAAAAAAA